MKKLTILSVAMMAAFCSNAYDITIGSPDNKVQTGAQTGYQWDLEKATLQGSTLRLIGSWNFVSGFVRNSGATWASGDIFFNKGGDNDGSLTGWDYALDVNWSAGTYNVVMNPTASAVSEFPVNSPFLVTGGTTIGNGTFSQQSDTAANLGVLDWSLSDPDPKAPLFTTQKHYYVDFDISAILALTPGDLTGHFTMSCGNDDLDFHIPDGGLTVAMLGLALTGMGLIRRRMA